jgi:transposase
MRDLAVRKNELPKAGLWRMRGEDQRTGGLFSYVHLEARVPAAHPLRPIRAIVEDALIELSGEFAALYSHLGRPSIAPERLLRALLLQAFYSVRSERLLLEQLDYNLLFRWFARVGRRAARGQAKGSGSTIRSGIRPRSRPTATGC